jgi:hypothetical protein
MNIKIELTEVGCESVDYVQLGQAINFRFYKMPDTV